MGITPGAAVLCVIGAGWLLPALASAQAAAPRALTLAEARAMAQQSSPELEAARQSLAAAAARRRQAGAFANPTLSYSREQTSRDGDASSQDIVAVDQPFEIGGQRGARRAAAEAMHRAAEARHAGTAARVAYDVTRSYAASVAAHRRAALAGTAAEAFQRAARVSRTRLAGGDISGYENRRLLLEAARYAALSAQAVVARDSADRMLASLLGLADSAGFQGTLHLVDTLLTPPLALRADSMVALAITNRAELRAAALDAEAAEFEARLSRAERIPTPVLTGGYKHERIAAGVSASGFVAGVAFPLPIWDRRGGAVDAARAEAARRDAEVDVLRRETVREIGGALESHGALAAQLETLRSQLGEEAGKALAAAETAYAEGEIGLLEWLDSVRAYHEAETTWTTLRAEYIARRAALERLTGATLF